MAATEQSEAIDPAIMQMVKKLPLFAAVKDKSLETLRTGKGMGDIQLRPLQFAVYENGAVVVNQGEFTSNFYVVLDGVASVFKNMPDGQVTRLGALGAQDWFGEMSTLSHLPVSATVRADTRLVVIVLDVPLFNNIYKNDPSFKKCIDDKYRDRALAGHLASAPIFKGLDRAALKRLSKEAELVIYKDGEVIAKAGEPADAVLLVRSGIIKGVRQLPSGQEEVCSFLCANSSLGERTLERNGQWPLSYVCMTRVDAVRLSRSVFDTLQQDDVKALGQIQMNASAMVRIETADLEAPPPPPIAAAAPGAELLVGREVVKGGQALVINLKRCTRCNLCVESCVAVHEDRVPRLSKTGIRSGDSMLASACYHCKIPECMLACNYGAIRRDVKGAIRFVWDNCVGCTACERKCPYGVIRMAEAGGASVEASPPLQGLLSLMPFLRGLLGKPAEATPAPTPEDESAPKRKAIKCDLCEGLPFEACVYNCPCSAISRVTPEELATLPV